MMAEDDEMSSDDTVEMDAATGPMMAMPANAGGTLAYCAAMAAGFKVADLHQIVIGVTAAGVLMVVGTLAGKQKEDARMDVFFPTD